MSRRRDRRAPWRTDSRAASRCYNGRPAAISARSDTVYDSGDTATRGDR